MGSQPKVPGVWIPTSILAGSMGPAHNGHAEGESQRGLGSGMERSSLHTASSQHGGSKRDESPWPLFSYHVVLMAAQKHRRRRHP